MRLLFTIIAMGCAAFLGYKYEPQLRTQLTGLPVNPPETPSQETITETTEVIEATEEVAPPAPAPTPQPEPETIAQQDPPAPEPEVAAPDLTPESAPTPEPEVSFAEPPTPEPKAQPEPMPEIAGESAEPEPVPAEPTFITPPAQPAPASDTANTASQATSSIVTLMQQHIRDGGIKEFTINQVTDWEVGPDELIQGQTYQTGIATYKAETIFGMKNIKAKALFQNGQLVRWIWPKSQLEIK